MVSLWDATVETVKMAFSFIPGMNLTWEGEEAEETDLIKALQENFTPFSVVTFSVFVLLYIP